MPKHTLYLTDEAIGCLGRVSNQSKFASRAIVSASREYAEARTLVAEALTRDELLATLDATNGLFITPDMPVADQVAADVADSDPARVDLANRLLENEPLCRALITIRDAYFGGVDDLSWMD